MRLCNTTNKPVGKCDCGIAHTGKTTHEDTEIHAHVGKAVIGMKSQFEINKEVEKTLSEKLRHDLIPVSFMDEVALAFTIGARKHSIRPEQDTTTDDQEYAAIQRHINAWRRGEWEDSEGFSHLAGAAARLGKLIARRKDSGARDGRESKPKENSQAHCSTT